MKGSVGRYLKREGVTEIRIHFPVWTLADGRTVHNVTIFPHLCGTCIGGDHTHVEINDVRMPIEVLKDETVQLSDEHVSLVSAYLESKLAVYARTQEFHEYVSRVT